MLYRELFLSHFPRGCLGCISAMQCDHCDSKATVFFTQIIGGSSKKSALCEKCASENGVADPESLVSDIEDVSSISEQAASGVGIPHESSSSLKEKPRGADSQECAGCGFTFDDLKKIGRLGCSQCYQSFREEIKLNLEGMHKDTCHIGCAPDGMIEALEYSQQLEKLEQEKAAAIISEDFERAAVLHEEIEKFTTSTAADNNTPDTEI